ncbi:hypothetical protein GQX74_013795 [Glossina fuscipes]|nr:hypothetical protein GQX74_013795 [Glossina fuscipes]
MKFLTNDNMTFRTTKTLNSSEAQKAYDIVPCRAALRIITQRVFAICVTIAAIRYKQTVLGFESANNELAVRRLLTYTTANRKPIAIVVNVAVRIARDGVIYHVNRVSNVAQVCLKMLILMHCAKPVSGSLIRISIIIKVTSNASNEKTRCSGDCDFFTIYHWNSHDKLIIFNKH